MAGHDMIKTDTAEVRVRIAGVEGVKYGRTPVTFGLDATADAASAEQAAPGRHE